MVSLVILGSFYPRYVRRGNYSSMYEEEHLFHMFSSLEDEGLQKKSGYLLLFQSYRNERGSYDAVSVLKNFKYLMDSSRFRGGKFVSL